MISVMKNSLSKGPDYNHAEDPTYKHYRQEAQRFYDKRTRLSQKSQEAHQRGQKSEAHQLSEQLKNALRQAEDCNKKAAQYVFVQNNADSRGNEIDLHGLYVKEAKWILQKRIAEAVRTNQAKLEVIVGKGNHSQNGVAKLKPAIDELCSEAGLNHYIEPNNSGVLVIDFTKTHNIRLPDSWDTLPISSPAVHGNQYQYQYQNQQPQYHQQGPHHGGRKKSPIGKILIRSLIKVARTCFNLR